MKVLMINGSPRKDGNTSIALEEMRQIFYYIKYANRIQPVLELYSWSHAGRGSDG